jgi:hypothetical protein
MGGMPPQSMPPHMQQRPMGAPAGAPAVVQQQPIRSEPEPQKKAPIGLILGLVGAIIAIAAVSVWYFVLREQGGADEVAEKDGKDGAGETAPGTLNLTLTPPDAMVKIDGAEHAGNSPRVISGLAPGKHTIEVSKGDTFLPFTQELTITSGQTLDFPPIKLPVTGVTLMIKVDPQIAAIALVAGTETTAIGSGAESHKHQLARKAGVEYSITGTAEGYEPVSVPIVFTGDAAQDVTISMVAKSGGTVAVNDPTPTPPPDPTPDPVAEKKPKPKSDNKPKNAELKIGVAPGMPPADVFVDGKKQSKKTPVFVKVSAGSHTVKWKWDDGKTDTQSVSVAANESKLLKGSK